MHPLRRCHERYNDILVNVHIAHTIIWSRYMEIVKRERELMADSPPAGFIALTEPVGVNEILNSQYGRIGGREWAVREADRIARAMGRKAVIIKSRKGLTVWVNTPNDYGHPVYHDNIKRPLGAGSIGGK